MKMVLVFLFILYFIGFEFFGILMMMLIFFGGFLLGEMSFRFIEVCFERGMLVYSFLFYVFGGLCVGWMVFIGCGGVF